MIPRSVEHLTAVMDLARDVEFVVDVLQFPGSAPKEGWILQDGTRDTSLYPRSVWKHAAETVGYFSLF